MRQLSNTFMNALNEGHLNPLTNLVRDDDSLDFQIRENEINIYFKGNVLLKLHSNYKITIDDKFTKGCDKIEFLNEAVEVTSFIKNVPYIKHQITLHSSTNEREYEQLFIRTNNCDLNPSEYFILDRQYTREGETNSQLDMIGLHWSRNNRQKNKTVPLSIFEIKYALNNDISTVHEQLQRYYDYVNNNFENLAMEMESILKQKTSLKVLSKSKKYDIDKKLGKLSIVKDPKLVHYVIVLVDYNPNSTLLNLNILRELEFYKQVKIFHCGLGLWSQFFDRNC